MLNKIKSRSYLSSNHKQKTEISLQEKKHFLEDAGSCESTPAPNSRPSVQRNASFISQTLKYFAKLQHIHIYQPIKKRARKTLTKSDSDDKSKNAIFHRSSGLPNTVTSVTIVLIQRSASRSISSTGLHILAK